ncbi:ACP S-malonyltransferase [Pseudomonadota bacterium]
MMRAFIFPGQGSQTVGMGKDFYNSYSKSRAVFEEVDKILGRKLSDIIFNGPMEELTKTENAQPALMTVSIAILRALETETGENVGSLCDFVAGHSLGEYSALCASEAISLSQIAKLLEIRGNAFAEVGKKSGGSMAALIGVDIKIAEKIAEKSKKGNEICQVANDNSLGQVVISGNETAIDRSIEIAKEMGVKRAIKLPVSGAFHSELMVPAKEVMKKALDSAKIHEPTIPLIANVSANQVFTADEIRESLIQQITGRVRWRETLQHFKEAGVTEFVEIGSGKVLSGLVAKTLQEVKIVSISNVEEMKEYLNFII